MFKGDRNFAVGLFVSIAIASFIFFVVWLTGRTGSEELTKYTLLFEKDITGLSVGSSVKYMGMNIGTVTQMQLEQKNGIRIRVTIDILESTPVDHGTYATLALQGITGVAVVNLASDPGDHTQLKVPEGEEYPIIPVRITGFSALLANAPEIMEKLDHLLTEAGQILGEENQASITGLLNNIEDITASLAEEREAIGAIPGNLNQTISEIQTTVVQFQDMLSELQPGLNSTIANANKSAENLASLTNRIDQLVADNEPGLDRFMDEGLAAVPDLMNEAQMTLRELEKLVQELQDDPSQLIYRQADNSVKMEP